MSGMPAPSIPNLLTLRASRGSAGRARGRARGRGRGGGGDSPYSASTSSPDAIVQGTDTDAAVSRMSAVDLGYLQDRYAQFFVQRPAVGNPVRRLPIINRGTYTRTTAIDKLISVFLSATSTTGAGGGTRQIISLGAGTDTRAFRLFKEASENNVIYHELDFPAVTDKKFQLATSTPVLRDILRDSSFLEQEGQQAHQQQTWRNEHLPNNCEYWCHGIDLRDLASRDHQPEEKPENSPTTAATTTTFPPVCLPGLKTDVPTLLISECCLCYLESHEAAHVISHFTSLIPGGLGIILYEPLLHSSPPSAFGQQMVSNLSSRGIRMPTTRDFTTVASQQARLHSAGFDSFAACATIEMIWDEWVSPQEKDRVDALEGLDEIEEWKLLAHHYSVSWGYRGLDLAGWRMGTSQ
ncbi:leucine carboxyl methyltransferase [Xylariaceae sp. FL0255]|nr:leucine carboxyl methyltransferase [Xylariaceae sp. FL0255]